MIRKGLGNSTRRNVQSALLSSLRWHCSRKDPLVASHYDEIETRQGAPSSAFKDGSLLHQALDRMDEGIVDADTYASLLRGFGNARDLERGKRVHAHIVRSGNARDRFVLNLLVEMYGKCGDVESARQVFDTIRWRNVFSWTIMIAAYARNGHFEEALQLFRKMELEGTQPDKIAYVSVLDACAGQAFLAEGKLIHEDVVANGFCQDVVVGTALVNVYGKCNSLADARKVFDGMVQRDLISWNAMIAAYAANGRGMEAFKLFREMDLRPDRFTFVSLLVACSSLEDVKATHASIVANGLELDALISTSLINMYGKCGSVEDARSVFETMHWDDVVPWTAMIATYAQNLCSMEAIELFRRMDIEGIRPNEITFVSVFDACATTGALAEGKVFHAVLADGFTSDIIIGNTLVNMYGKCGSLKNTKSVFDAMPARNTISWNAVISVFNQNGHAREALELFCKMEQEGQKPDDFTFVTALDACANQMALVKGRELHTRICSESRADGVLGNSLINLYGKCGDVDEARRVFDMMLDRNLVTWNAMITAYTQNGCRREALQLFQELEKKDMKPNTITFLSVLDACTQVSQGKLVHASIAASGLEADVFVGTALLSMYGKCGSLEDAWRVFHKMDQKNVVSWTAMIAAYSQNGNYSEALDLFRTMVLEGMKPNRITFVGLLFACSHGGLRDESFKCFVSMQEDYGIPAIAEHYGCMIDLLSRVGRLDQAEDLLNGMPFEPDAVSWLTLLGACRTHGNDMERAARCGEHLSKLDPKCAAPYVMLSNMHAEAGITRKLIEERGMKKRTNCDH